MSDYLDRVERQLTQLTERGAHQRLRARRPGFAGVGAAPPGPRGPRWPSGALALLAAAVVVAAVAAVVLVNVHSGKPQPASATAPAPAAHHPKRSPSTVTTTPAPSTVTSTPAPPSHPPTTSLPIPAHFAPQSFSAISELTWWLLGPAPCTFVGEQPPCGEVLRTTDGGRSFIGVQAPHATLAGPNASAGFSQIRFADLENGFAFGPDLYVTHDGGTTWSAVRLGGPVLDLAISNGQVYAIVGTTPAGLAGHLMHSPVTHGSWTTLSAAGVVSGGLWVQGSDVIVQSGVGTGIGGTVLVSSDGGQSFTAHPAPSPGLPCQFAAPAPPVVWARCATGTESGVWRSTDLGAHFAPVNPASRPGQPNSAAFAAASADTAVYGYQQLYRTADGGATWTPVGPSGIAQWAYLGFTDATHGVGLAYVGSIAPGNERLYYTTDGGQSYHLVPLP